MISNTVGKRSAVAKIAVYFLHEKKKGISLRSNSKPHMKKLLSTKYSAAAFNIAMLILRIGACGLMIPHGYDKLIHFTSYKAKFMNFLGMGPTLSLALVVFAEFFCALFVLIGLFSRLACIPVIVAMCVALFKSHDGDIFGKGEHAALFITCYLVILIVGPGKISADGITGK